ncbi:MAG TPA: hypothetical protein VFX60_15655 [Micromonospora sp.]|nr:hypothetical protein [Micromonospora sp.]
MAFLAAAGFFPVDAVFSALRAVVGAAFFAGVLAAVAPVARSVAVAVFFAAAVFLIGAFFAPVVFLAPVGRTAGRVVVALFASAISSSSSQDALAAFPGLRPANPSEIGAVGRHLVGE